MMKMMQFQKMDPKQMTDMQSIIKWINLLMAKDDDKTATNPYTLPMGHGLAGLGGLLLPQL